jgi:hypothetical protein
MYFSKTPALCRGGGTHATDIMTSSIDTLIDKYMDNTTNLPAP